MKGGLRGGQPLNTSRTKNMGMHSKITRQPDAELVQRLHYAISKLSVVTDEYENDALPNTKVMNNLTVVQALVNDIKRKMEARL